MLSTPSGSRTFWLGQVSDAATALAAPQNSECSDGDPKTSEVEIRYFGPSYGRAGMQAPDSSKYKLPAVLGGMVAVVLAISLTAFAAIGQLPLRGMWHQLTQHAIGLSSSLGSAVPSIGTEPSARLVARPRQGIISSGPTPLGLAVEGRAEGAVVAISGLTPDMELSAGDMIASDKWQISVAELGSAWIAPPENFAGSIDLVAELHLSNGEIADRVTIQFEWVSPLAPPPAQHETVLEQAPPAVALAFASANVDRAESLSERPILPSPAEEQPDGKERPESEVLSAVTPSPPDRKEIAARPTSAPAPSLPQLEHDEIAASPPISRLPTQDQIDQKEITVLLNRGKNLMASGDLAAARIVLRRAVDASNAEAALALAATYDPFVLRELKVYGFTGDAAMARTWYEKAGELGSSVAPRRLEMLTRRQIGPLR
jgi:hypothetical protein